MKDVSKIKSYLKGQAQVDPAVFKQSHCLLLISVGQQSHEGRLFEATLEMVDETFGQCTIALYDSLQRYTMALKSEQSAEQFHELANREGDLWLQRNERYLQNLSCLTEITRWDAWLGYAGYHRQRDKLKSFISSNQEYQESFELSVTKYLDKYISRLPDKKTFDVDRAKKLCFEYILEECTVLVLWTTLNCQFELYPGKHNIAMEETRKRFIYPNNPMLMRAIQIGFRGLKKIEPQRFTVLDPTAAK